MENLGREILDIPIMSRDVSVATDHHGSRECLDMPNFGLESLEMPKLCRESLDVSPGPRPGDGKL